ncbi:collagen alpha-1(III) chain-like isoform X2 [Pipra filicauda]|uniref:Collagen alpha-1(III) chain-like isoform X2 n=1 Tax=Pipra filicauda TaxID=649802 RepID=A0A7R5KID6_9PASS|nr:collagen alpha-1(III) chain-like isoform X2 [Pipra filicauda]
MLRERSALGAGVPARRLLPALRRARGAERGRHRHRRTEAGLELRWGSAAVRGSASPESLRGGRWGRARQGRSGRGSAAARLGENGGAFLVQTRNPGRDRPGRGDTPGRPRDPPIPPGPQRRPHLPRDRSSSLSGTPEDIAPPPEEHRPPPSSPRPQEVPARRAPRERGVWGPPGLRPRTRSGRGEPGPCRGREERGQPLPRSSRAPGPRAELCLSVPCLCVCPQAAPGAGADRAAGRAQAAPSSACGISAIAPNSSLPCHPEGAAPLTPARRGRSCLGGKRLQERKPRNAQPDAAARVKGGKDRRIHPMVAKVLVQRLFPGINEPNKPRGILCSEAKALVECRRLVPPARGRLLQFPREKNRNSQPPRPDSPLQPELSTQPERQFQHLKGKKRTKKVIYFGLKLL